MNIHRGYVLYDDAGWMRKIKNDAPSVRRLDGDAAGEEAVEEELCCVLLIGIGKLLS